MTENTISIQMPEVFEKLFAPARYKVFYGGRGGGKSHAFAEALLILGVSKPLRILCCREIQQSINDSVKRVLDDKIEKLGLGKFYRSTNTEITGINKTLIFFAGLHNNISSLKSKEGIDICWIEEAETVSRESIDKLIPTIRKEHSEIWISFNPDKESSPVYQKFISSKKPPPDCIIKKVNYWDNPYFPKTLRDEMEWDRKTDIDKYRHIWEGNLRIQTQASVMKAWKSESFTAPYDAVFYYGADWGFSNDPTTLVRCYFDDKKRKLYIDYEAYGIGIEIDKLPELFMRVPDSKKWEITADNSRPETISYMNGRNGGFRIVPSKKGAGSIEEGIVFLQKYQIIVHPRCKHVIDELKMYSYKIDRKTGEILPVIEDKHNHCMDALRYATEKKRRPEIFV